MKRILDIFRRFPHFRFDHFLAEVKSEARSEKGKLVGVTLALKNGRNDFCP